MMRFKYTLRDANTLPMHQRKAKAATAPVATISYKCRTGKHSRCSMKRCACSCDHYA